MFHPHVFDAEERRRLLNECFVEMAKDEEFTRAFDNASDDEAELMEPAFQRQADRVASLWRQYRDSLPVLPMSRCPFTGQLWRHSFDPYGLDGFWWNYDKPLRPYQEPYGGRYLCFTGAVKLARILEKFPFLCRPGPEAPFVVANLMADNRVKAVISQVPVGRHTGYLIVYYAPQPEAAEFRTADWGIETARWVDRNNVPRRMEGMETPQHFDFDLRRWIDRGRLAWIRPGDESHSLQYEARGCPYLDLSGRRQPCDIQDGRILVFDSGKSAMVEW